MVCKDTAVGGEYEAGGAGEEGGRGGGREGGDGGGGGEVVEEVEGGDGAQAPPQCGREEELHPLDGAGLEDISRIAELEVEQQRHVRLLHLRRNRHARHRQQLHRPTSLPILPLHPHTKILLN